MSQARVDKTLRDFCRLQEIVHCVRFLGLAASTSNLTHFSLSLLLIRPRPANQLVLVHGDASGSISQLSSRTRILFAADVFCAWTRTPHCLVSVLRVVLGDNESCDSTLCIFTPETGRCRRKLVPCLFSFSHQTQSSGARAGEARGSGLDFVTRGQPSNTHLWPGCDNQRHSSGSYVLKPGYQSKSRGWHSGFVCEKFSAKNKIDRLQKFEPC